MSIGLGGVYWFAAAEAASEASSSAKSASRHARNASSKIKELEDRLEGLTLTCMAMWELIRDSGQFNEEDLMEKITEIDLRDGTLDGKLKTKRVSQCHKCGRKMSLRHTKCMYCGSTNLAQKPFDKVR